jgi:hypothetical protein
MSIDGNQNCNSIPFVLAINGLYHYPKMVRRLMKNAPPNVEAIAIMRIEPAVPVAVARKPLKILPVALGVKKLVIVVLKILPVEAAAIVRTVLLLVRSKSGDCDLLS